MKPRAPVVVVLLAISLAGCAVAPPGGRPDDTRREDAAEAPAPPDAEGRDRARALPDSVRALVTRAETASAEGRHMAAADTLERAVRVAPDNAVVWQNLAVVRYRQERCDQAINLARRSSDFAAERALQAENWRLIAACRRRLGDEAGAREAAARARGLRERP